MKRFFLILAIQVISVSLFAQGIEFRDLALDQAVEQAKSEGKYIFIDVYTDWCGPCKMMDKQVFTLAEVGQYFNQKYVNLKYNAEKGEIGPEVAKKFGVKAYPTFLILDSDGNLIHMFAGGTLGVQFIDKVEESFDPEKAFGVLEGKYQSGDRSVKLLANYLKALQGTFRQDVTAMIEEFADTLSKEELISEECLFLFDDYARLGSAREEFLTENLDQFREVVGKEKIDQVLLKKFEAYYAGILGRQRVADPLQIESVNNKLASLGLENTKLTDLYQAIIEAYVNKTDASRLFDMIVEQTPLLEKNQKDRILYFAIPALHDQFDQLQKETLLSMMDDDYTKNALIKSLERLDKQAEK